MKHFSATELGNRTGDVLSAALQAPVAIDRHGKARFVLLSTEEYDKMTSRKDPRQAFNVRDMPDAESLQLIQALQHSIDNE